MKNLNNNLRSSSQDFTLVENSIVLIIGVLISGILAGKALIEHARIRQVISEVQNINSAFTSFQSAYNQLLGDITNIPSHTTTLYLVANSNFCTMHFGLAGYVFN